MPLTALVRQLQRVPLTGEVLARLGREERLRLSGASRAARALIASALAGASGAPLLVIVPTLEEAGRWAALLELMGWNSSQLYPTSEGSPYEPFDPTSEITWGQLQVLSELVDGGGKGTMAIVATERALQPHLPPPDALAACCRSLRKRDTVDLQELGDTLTRLGYERVPEHRAGGHLEPPWRHRRCLPRQRRAAGAAGVLRGGAGEAAGVRSHQPALPRCGRCGAAHPHRLRPPDRRCPEGIHARWAGAGIERRGGRPAAGGGHPGGDAAADGPGLAPARLPARLPAGRHPDRH